MKGAVPHKPDVVVVGAGAAGLSAAQALGAAGLKTVTLEAADHIGGRCVTDTTAFSAPFDRGGSWMHSANINPLAHHAEATGATLHKTAWQLTAAHSRGQTLSEADFEDYRAYADGLWDAVYEAGDGPTDSTIDAALPPSRWKAAARHLVATMDGADADQISLHDNVAYDWGDDSDWLVEGGYGAFLASMHADVAVKCGCPVSAIRYGATTPEVVTPDGTLRAEQVVVTVSTGVLAAERIHFDPPLPDDTLHAIDHLPNGLLNKVGIEFDPAWQEAVLGDRYDFHTSADQFVTLFFGFYGSTLATGFVGGHCADQLERDGPGAATALCRDALRSFFGSGVEKSILKTSETAWRSDPLTLGSYSYAKQGGAWARQALATPVDNRLFFAGEATMPHSYATVHGAWLSGQRVAQQILAARTKGT